MPFIGNRTGDLLLWALFDRTRHGLAHQYQQIIANLTDDIKFFIELYGADHLKNIQSIQNARTADRYMHFMIWILTSGFHIAEGGQHLLIEGRRTKETLREGAKGIQIVF